MPLCRCLLAGTGPGSKGLWAPNGRFVTMTRLFARWPLPVAVVLALLLQGALAAPCAAHGWNGHISKTKTVTVTTTTTKTCGTIAPVAVQPVAPVYVPATLVPRSMPRHPRRLPSLRSMPPRPMPRHPSRRRPSSLRSMPPRPMPRHLSAPMAFVPATYVSAAYAPAPVAPAAFVPAAYAPAPAAPVAPVAPLPVAPLAPTPQASGQR